ncbi:MAG: class II aldolase/adducin family protein [Synergistaceae bacterium]|jgi:ribulose-5-phosphate 4-epimerase/fuculose-1-phosphate aldolase|nr:class II aldolase/adducin family protein [Synergistaceae bacterium]
MKYLEIRRAVLDAILESRTLGLIHGTSGNVSMRCGDETAAAITPSGIPYDGMKPEDISVVGISGGEWLDGPFKPSSETPMHTAIYRARADVAAIVHTHSLYATVMSMRPCPLDAATVPSCAYFPIQVVPFALPGSAELADLASRVIGLGHDAILLRNHGLIAVGADMASALACAVYTEECAQVNYYAELIGYKNYIPEEQAEKIREAVKGGKAV